MNVDYKYCFHLIGCETAHKLLSIIMASRRTPFDRISIHSDMKNFLTQSLRRET